MKHILSGLFSMAIMIAILAFVLGVSYGFLFLEKVLGPVYFIVGFVISIGFLIGFIESLFGIYKYTKGGPGY